MKYKIILLLPLLLIFSGCSFSDYLDKYNQAKETQAEQTALKEETKQNIDNYYAIFGLQEDSCNFEDLTVGGKVILGSFWVKTNGITSVEEWPVSFVYNLESGSMKGIVKLEKEYATQGASVPFNLSPGLNTKVLHNNMGDFNLKNPQEDDNQIDEFYYLTYTLTEINDLVTGQNAITTKFSFDSWLITADEETEEAVPAGAIKIEGDNSIRCTF